MYASQRRIEKGPFAYIIARLKKACYRDHSRRVVIIVIMIAIVIVIVIVIVIGYGDAEEASEGNQLRWKGAQVPNARQTSRSDPRCSLTEVLKEDPWNNVSGEARRTPECTISTTLLRV